MNFVSGRGRWVGGAIAMILIATFFFGRYNTYIYAKTWHWFHESTVRFAGHEIELPALWWVTNSDNRGQIKIIRAWRATAISAPVIEVRPAFPGEVAQSDHEQERLAEAIVALRNRQPASRWKYSVVTLIAKNSNLYCIKDELIASNAAAFTTLACHAPQLPYSLHYEGAATLTGEAESVLMTLR